MSEPLYLCLVYGGLAALLVALEDRRPGLLQAAGGLFGMTYLVRPEAVGYVGVSLLVVLVGAVRRSLGPLRRAWLALGGFVIAFGLVAAQGGTRAGQLAAPHGRAMAGPAVDGTVDEHSAAGGTRSGARAITGEPAAPSSLGRPSEGPLALQDGGALAARAYAG